MGNKKIQYIDIVQAILEGVILLSLATLIIVGGYRYLAPLLGGKTGQLMPEWFFTAWGLSAILGFDILWIVAVLAWKPGRYIRPRVYLTTMIMSVSVALGVVWVIIRGFAASMH